MKYRRLLLEELEKVDKEFVDFLAINGISSDHWQELKSDPAKVNSILDSFSDAWFEMYLRKINYLLTDLGDEILCFQCNGETIVLAGIRSQHVTASNLSERISRMMADKRSSVFSQTKKYQNSRELELFQMLEKGAKVSDGRWFKQISLLLAADPGT